MLRSVCLCTPHTVLRIRHPFLTLAAVSVFSKSVRPWRLFAGLAVGLPKHDRAFAMEEKASEGNVSYFSEYPSADLEPRLVKHRDEDGRSLLHTAAAAGTRAPHPSLSAFVCPDPALVPKSNLTLSLPRTQASTSSWSFSWKPRTPGQDW